MAAFLIAPKGFNVRLPEFAMPAVQNVNQDYEDTLEACQELLKSMIEVRALLNEIEAENSKANKELKDCNRTKLALANTIQEKQARDDQNDVHYSGRLRESTRAIKESVELNAEMMTKRKRQRQ
jgi:hypothetical protein